MLKFSVDSSTKERAIALVKRALERFGYRGAVDPASAFAIYLVLFLRDPLSSFSDEYKSIVRSLLRNKFVSKVRLLTVGDEKLSALVTSLILLSAGGGNASSIKQALSELLGADIDLDALRDVARMTRELGEESKRKAKLISRAVAGKVPGELVTDSSVAKEVLELCNRVDIEPMLELSEKMYQYIREGKEGVKGTSITGVELGADPSRIVYSELALPDDVFFLKYSQSKLLLYNKDVVTPGAIYVLVDKSDSMDGLKIMWAKALAIALMRKALENQRDFYIRFFDARPHKLFTLKYRSTMKDRLNFMKFIASVLPDGGTNIYAALIQAIRDIEKNDVRGTRTIYLITDGMDLLPEEKIKRMLESRDIVLISILISGSNKSLKKVSKRYIELRDLSYKEARKIVLR